MLEMNLLSNSNSTERQAYLPFQSIELFPLMTRIKLSSYLKDFGLK